MLWLIFTVFGGFTGFFAGLLGIGGGLIMVPVLTLLFGAFYLFPTADVLHMALGTSSATIMFTSIASLRAHHKHGAVLWNVFWQITPGAIVGTFLGALVASYIPTRPLAMFFTVFVSAIALQMALDLKPKASGKMPSKVGVFSVGAVIGVLSSLLAIGGAAFTVPFLSRCNVDIRKAIGTSAAVGLPVAAGSAVGYIFNGLSNDALQSHLPISLGYLYLPAMLCMVPTSMLCAPIGAKLAHRLPVKILKRIFAGLLVILAIRMLFSVL